MRLLESPARSRAALTLGVLRLPNDLARVSEEWRELCNHDGNAMPFQSPAWLLPWWRHFGQGALRVITVRTMADGALAALAPVVVVRASSGERILELLGTSVSDYGDIVVLPAVAREAAELIWNTLVGGDEWDRVDLQQIPAGSALLGAAIRHGGIEAAPQVPCPTLSLIGRREGWFPPGWRRKLDYDQRRLRRMATVEFVRADQRNLEELMTALVRLHGLRWSQKGGGAFADSRTRAFHFEVARAMLAEGALRLHALKLSGVIVACLEGFLVGRRLRYYIGGFDPAQEKFGIGNLLIEHAMIEAAGEGATTFDFLRGREAYKYRWGARDEPTFRLQFAIGRD